jgi:hypothetical protein
MSDIQAAAVHYVVHGHRLAFRQWGSGDLPLHQSASPPLQRDPGSPHCSRYNKGRNGFDARLAVPYFEFLWTDEILAHLREHGIGRKDLKKLSRIPAE